MPSLLTGRMLMREFVIPLLLLFLLSFSPVILDSKSGMTGKNASSHQKMKDRINGSGGDGCSSSSSSIMWQASGSNDSSSFTTSSPSHTRIHIGEAATADATPLATKAPAVRQEDDAVLYSGSDPYPMPIPLHHNPSIGHQTFSTATDSVRPVVVVVVAAAAAGTAAQQKAKAQPSSGTGSLGAASSSSAAGTADDGAPARSSYAGKQSRSSSGSSSSSSSRLEFQKQYQHHVSHQQSLHPIHVHEDGV